MTPGEIIQYRQGESKGERRVLVAIFPGYHEGGELDGFVVRHIAGTDVSAPLRADWFGPVES